MIPLPRAGFAGRVLVVGDVMLDHTVTGAGDRLSPEAPVPVVAVSNEIEQLGGAANVAVGVRALGPEVTLVGAIGADDAGGRLVKLLHTSGIVCGLVRIENRPTTTKSRVVVGNQQIVRVDREDTSPVPVESLVGKLESALDDRPDVVVLSDYAKGVLTDGLVRRIVDHCRSKSIRVVVDPKRRDFSVYRGSTVVTPNLSELIAASSIPLEGLDLVDIAARAQRLAQRHDIDAIVVTLGERGLIVCPRRGACCPIPAAAREVFDVTGAGDSVTATIAAALAHGLPIEASAGLANIAGGLAVGRRGTNIVGLEQLRAAVQGEARYPIMLADLLTLVEAWRAAGKKVVFTNGCFDLLHRGHVELLRQARACGDVLVVGINSDRSVRRLKGPDRPVVCAESRAALLGELRSVDAVTVFDDDAPGELVKLLAPDIIVKGGDYAPDEVVGAETVRERGGRVVIVPLVGEHSTTAIVERLRRS